MAVAGDLAVLAAEDDGVILVDVSDTSNPTYLAEVSTPNPAMDVAISGNLSFSQFR